MKKRAVSLILLIACWLPARAQHSSRLIIQRIELKDSVLVREITKLIAEETTTVGLVKQGFGYVHLAVQEYDDRSPFKRKYEFLISFYPLTLRDPNNKFPLFYTYVAGRLVLLDEGRLQRTLNLSFSKRSRRQLCRRINHCLEKPIRLVLPGPDGRKRVDRHARFDHLRFDSGKVVYIRHDGSALVRMANDFSPVK